MQNEITAEEELRRRRQSRRDRKKYRKQRNKAESDYRSEADDQIDRLAFPFK